MLLDVTRPSLKTISVTNACTDAPAGPKRDAAPKHYAAAEDARLAMREADANKRLDAAIHALG